MKNKKFVSFFFGLGVIFIVLSCLWIFSDSSKPSRYEIFYIEAGESFQSVSKRLEDKNLVGSDTFFYYLARLTGRTAELKAGEYELHDKMSPWEIINIITGGKVKLHRVTIQEGMNMFQIARRLEKKGLTDEVQFLESCWDQSFVEELKIPSVTVEGYLYPETYFIPRGIPPKGMIRMFVDRFWSEIPEDYLELARKSPLTLHEAVIMASMIEKETGLAGEMSLVSSVFHNRIERGMRLQSDPTAIYDILPYQSRVQRKHLFRSTPFNTYRIQGLPMTPIANPGRVAIEAALKPDQTDYIFFVSRRDGSHYFSRTYQEHKEAIDRFLR